MATNSKTDLQANVASYVKFILGGLLGMYISGVAMTSIGQPTPTHILTSGRNILWHLILASHFLFLAILTVSAIALLIIAFRKVQAIKARASIGLAAIVFGIASGVLVLHKVHPGIFLFCMALSVVLIGATYGPLAGNRTHNE